MKTTGVLLLLCVGLVGCGGAEAETAAPTKTKAPAAKPAAPVEPVKDPACTAAPEALLTTLAGGAEAGVGDLALTNGRAYKSPDYASVYFVAADLTAPGVSGETGVWATNALDGTGVYMAVDGFAKQFTVWPDADGTAAQISGADPGVSKAKGCA